MEKGFLFLLGFLIFAEFAGANVITGDVVTGRATSVEFSVSADVQGNPVLIINRPLNDTYFSTTNLRINITTNGNNFFYNLDEHTSYMIVMLL